MNITLEVETPANQESDKLRELIAKIAANANHIGLPAEQVGRLRLLCNNLLEAPVHSDKFEAMEVLSNGAPVARLYRDQFADLFDAAHPNATIPTPPNQVASEAADQPEAGPAIVAAAPVQAAATAQPPSKAPVSKRSVKGPKTVKMRIKPALKTKSAAAKKSKAVTTTPAKQPPAVPTQAMQPGGVEVRMALDKLDLDPDRQCRRGLVREVVEEYSERMAEGIVFPPIIGYGTEENAFVADGWHRVQAAKQIGLTEIAVDLRPGGVKDALVAALGANQVHGLRRTSADKRRAVELAIQHFAKRSNRAIAEMCGVSDMLVGTIRPKPQVQESCTSKVEGQDGKQYPVKVKSKAPVPANDAIPADTTHAGATDQPTAPDAPLLEPESTVPDVGTTGTMNTCAADPVTTTAMVKAQEAIQALQTIDQADPERLQALEAVRNWIDKETTLND